MRPRPARRRLRDYPVARGVAPPPGWHRPQPAPKSKFIAMAVICLLTCTALGWVIFQGPGAHWLRRLNYAYSDHQVAVAPAPNQVEHSALQEQAKLRVAKVPVIDSKPAPVKEIPKPAPEPKQEPNAPPATKPAPNKRRSVDPSFSQIVSIFQSKCYACHAAPKKKGGLDLRSLASIKKGGDSGPAVVPGKPDESPLWESIDTGRMPPDKLKRLSTAERELIRRWIESGAK